MNNIVTLDVSGMACDGCEGRVGDALAAAGLRDVEVDWRRGFASGIDTGSFDLTSARESLEGSDYEIHSDFALHAEPAGDTVATDGHDYDCDLLILGSGSVSRALVNRDTTGLVKMVADESTGELLGAHVLAQGAGDVIQAAVVAMSYHATVDEIAAMFHPYLTMVEALKLAAQTFNKDVKNLSCCAA